MKYLLMILSLLSFMTNAYGKSHENQFHEIHEYDSTIQDYYRLVNNIENTIQKDRLYIIEYCLFKATTGKEAIDNSRNEYFSTKIYLNKFKEWILSEKSTGFSMDELHELKRIIMRGFAVGTYSNTPSIEYANTIYSNCLHRFNVQ